MKPESVIVEVRAAEGGADAKDLVQLQVGIYLRWGASERL
jgi:protein subunit release factor B